MKIALFSSLTAVCLSFASLSQAEDLKQIFENVNKYYEEKNYSKALEELSWAQKEIEKAKGQVTQALFPAELEGYTGGKIESTNVFGISNVERTYTKSGAATIKVSLMGSSKGGGQNPLGGLAAFGQMAAMMGGAQPGVETFRIDGRTANLETKENSADLTLFLDGGSMIKFEMSKSKDGEALKKFAQGFNIAEIEKQLK
jgi:hypothetical protein